MEQSKLKGLLYSKVFWFNVATAFATLIGTQTELIHTLFGDQWTNLMLLVASVINIGLRFSTNNSLADKGPANEAARADNDNGTGA